MKVFVEDPLLFSPGEKQSYTTYGFTLLSSAMVQSTQTPFPDLVQKAVLQPAGMVHTVVEDWSKRQPSWPVADFHTSKEGRVVKAGYVNNSNKWAGGGYLSTSEDLVRFGLALLSEAILPRSKLEKMWIPAQLKGGKQASFGIGFDLRTLETWIEAKATSQELDERVSKAVGQLKVVGHAGGSVGARAIFFLLPERQLVLAGVSNSEHFPYVVLELLIQALATFSACEQ